MFTGQIKGWWWGKDSNLRRHKPIDLQSIPFDHFGTPPSQPSNLTNTNQAACNGGYSAWCIEHPVFRQRRTTRFAGGTTSVPTRSNRRVLKQDGRNCPLEKLESTQRPDEVNSFHARFIAPDDGVPVNRSCPAFLSPLKPCNPVTLYLCHPVPLDTLLSVCYTFPLHGTTWSQ